MSAELAAQNCWPRPYPGPGTNPIFQSLAPAWHALVPGLIAYVHRGLAKEHSKEPSMEDVVKETKKLAMLFTGETF